jgi:hypothetical protein
MLISEGDGGGVNPDWVEWLMGLPIGWSALQPLEMDGFRKSWLESFRLIVEANAANSR